ncbi:MAG: hypothetical protein GKR89_22325 [Candidatus Latescibacteria bacterium]|nr:hypothetical protein [Candidatus Latescibacterota bacterium]
MTRLLIVVMVVALFLGACAQYNEVDEDLRKAGECAEALAIGRGAEVCD